VAVIYDPLFERQQMSRLIRRIGGDTAVSRSP
jgi:hypothetical protein